MSKDSFLAFLRGAPKGATAAPAAPAAAGGWNVFSDDYLMGARMRDWGRPGAAGSAAAAAEAEVEDTDVLAAADVDEDDDV